ncbi:unnamed protein product, partial [marine sediment metagenome]
TSHTRQFFKQNSIGGAVIYYTITAPDRLQLYSPNKGFQGQTSKHYHTYATEYSELGDWRTSKEHPVLRLTFLMSDYIWFIERDKFYRTKKTYIPTKNNTPTVTNSTKTTNRPNTSQSGITPSNPAQSPRNTSVTPTTSSTGYGQTRSSYRCCFCNNFQTENFYNATVGDTRICRDCLVHILNQTTASNISNELEELIKDIQVYYDVHEEKNSKKETETITSPPKQEPITQEQLRIENIQHTQLLLPAASTAMPIMEDD